MSNPEFGERTRAGTGTDLADRPDTEALKDKAQDAKDQAQEAAGTAAQEGKRVASVAGSEVQQLAEEGKQHAAALLDEARSQLTDQSRAQRDHLVQTLQSLGTDLEQMSGQSDGLASDLVRQAAQRVRDVSGRLDGREPAEILDEVRQFARRRPGTFLLGALAAGVVAGRFARGAQKSQSSSGSSTTPVPTQRPAATGVAGLPATPAPTHAAPAPTHAAAPAPTPTSGAEAPFPADAPGTI